MQRQLVQAIPSVSQSIDYIPLVRQNAAAGRHKNAAIGAQDMRESQTGSGR